MNSPELIIDSQGRELEVGDFMHRLQCDAIMFWMKVDLEHLLDDFADRWGIER